HAHALGLRHSGHGVDEEILHSAYATAPLPVHVHLAGAHRVRAHPAAAVPAVPATGASLPTLSRVLLRGGNAGCSGARSERQSDRLSSSRSVDRFLYRAAPPGWRHIT